MRRLPTFLGGAIRHGVVPWVGWKDPTAVVPARNLYHHSPVPNVPKDFEIFVCTHFGDFEARTRQNVVTLFWVRLWKKLLRRDKMHSNVKSHKSYILWTDFEKVSLKFAIGREAGYLASRNILHLEKKTN